MVELMEVNQKRKRFKPRYVHLKFEEALHAVTVEPGRHAVLQPLQQIVGGHPRGRSFHEPATLQVALSGVRNDAHIRAGTSRRLKIQVTTIPLASCCRCSAH